ncbi:MAG: tetratricopeptide repeat protein, partial [Rudaea sp.]
ESGTVLGRLQPRGLVEAQLESKLEGETEWSFHHNLLRDVTYESVLKRERAELHRAAADWLKVQAGRAGRLDEFAGLLAEHFERAGQTQEAADWYLRAAKRAVAQGALREARRAYDRALDLLPPIEWERRWNALFGRQHNARPMGDVELQRTDVAALVELAREHDDTGRLGAALQMRGTLRGESGDHAGGLQDLEQALILARQTGDAVIETRALASKALALAQESDPGTAIPLIEEALPRARELGDQETIIQVLVFGSIIFVSAGDLARAVELQQEQVAFARARHNSSSESLARLNLGASYIWLGQYKRARGSLEESLRLADFIGARAWRQGNLANLGEVYFFSGDHRQALAFLEDALREARAMNLEFEQAVALEELGVVLASLGDIPRAEQRYLEARAMAQAMNHLALAQEGTAGLGHCALEQGRLDQARQFALETWEYLEQHGAKNMEHPMRPFGICADIFDALGESELSRAVVEAGYRELMTRANKISNPEWRASYLENDPFNRELVALWERMQS